MYANTSKIKVCFKYFHLDISGVASDFSEDITSLYMAIYYPLWTPPNKPEPFHWNCSFIFVSWIGLPWLISFKPRLSNESTFTKNNFQECFPSECPRHLCPNILWNLDFFFEILPHRFLAFILCPRLSAPSSWCPPMTNSLSLSHSKLLLSHTHTHTHTHIQMTLSMVQ